MPKPWTFVGIAVATVALRCVLVAVGRTASDFEELWIIAIGAMILGAVSAWGWRKVGKGALALASVAALGIGGLIGYTRWETVREKENASTAPGLWMQSAEKIWAWQAATEARAKAEYKANPRAAYALPLMGPIAPAGYDAGLWRSFAETWDEDIQRGVALKGDPGFGSPAAR